MIKCHDCEKEIKVKENEIQNGIRLVYSDGDEKIEIYKCKSCYKKDPSLINFRKCEVYSRIVGYLRPIQQWNPGKQEEYRQRENYKIKDKPK